jgi:hypothetical protein
MKKAFLVLVLAASTHAGVARGNDRVAAAQALFDEARTLMARGDYPAACGKFEGSESLDPGAGTEYNLALCYEKSGRTASAWATYLNAAASYKATNRPEWELRARDHAHSLESTLSRLTIVLSREAPPSVRLSRDGTSVVDSTIGVAIPVDPGTHVVTANVDGRPEWKKSVTISPGASAAIEIPGAWGGGGGGRPAPVAAPPEADASPETSAPSSGRRTIALIVGGVGVAALGLGAVSGFSAINKNSTSEKDCPTSGICRSQAALDANDSARKWATVSTVSFIAAGVLLATSITLFVTATPASARTRAALRLVPGGGAVGGAW